MKEYYKKRNGNQARKNISRLPVNFLLDRISIWRLYLLILEEKSKYQICQN